MAQQGSRRRWDDDDDNYEKFHFPLAEMDFSDYSQLGRGCRWSTWVECQAGQRGPQPYPLWLVTEAAAVDSELGVLKTGKEADVHLVERAVPGASSCCLLAAKRYRSAEHRMFHRDAGYLEGRRMRRSRENRAMAGRTAFGRALLAEQWAAAEFSALVRLWQAGVPVPYPVQVLGSELLLEFVGDEHGRPAPRLVELPAEHPDLVLLWAQLVDAMALMARLGLCHGDLSPYNLLVDDGRLVIIDLPQVVDVVANPQGVEYLRRDVSNVSTWFAKRGVAEPDPEALLDSLLAEAGCSG